MTHFEQLLGKQYVYIQTRNLVGKQFWDIAGGGNSLEGYVLWNHLRTEVGFKIDFEVADQVNKLRIKQQVRDQGTL